MANAGDGLPPEPSIGERLSRRASRSNGLTLLLPHDAQLELWPERPDEPLDRPRRRVTQRADRVSLDLVAQLLEHVDLLELRIASHKPAKTGAAAGQRLPILLVQQAPGTGRRMAGQSAKGAVRKVGAG